MSTRNQDMAVTSAIQSKPHYPFVTRMLIELFISGALPNVQAIDIEPEYGFAVRIVYDDGSVRLFRGTSVGWNNHGAAEIAKDKGYTKYFLQRLGYATPAGKVFLLPQYAQAIDRNLSRFGFSNYALADSIDSFVQAAIGYPCYVKPNAASQGTGINRCINAQELQAVVAEYQRQNINVLLVEEEVRFPDYRVLVVRDEVIACYLRRPLSVVGDGVATIRELLHRKQVSLAQAGRYALISTDDPRIQRKLEHSYRTLETVPDDQELVQIYDISNLSVGGDAEDYTDRIHAHWRELCIRVAADMGLAFCGVDLACADISNADAAYSILEINAAPGLDNYAAQGDRQAAIVRNLYQRLFNERHQHVG